LAFIPDPRKAILDFVYYTLPHFQRELKHIGEGSVQDNINLGTFQDILFPIPPLPEQKAIALVLSSLDDKIDLLHRQNKTLEAMAETLFRQWFVEDADEGLEEGKILDYCVHHKDSVKPQKQPNELFSHYSIPAFDNNLNPVIERGSEIQSNKYSVVQNSFLFSKLNPNKVKRIWLILDDLNENAICSTEFQVVRPKDKKYLFFTYLWLSIPQNYDEIASGVGGTSGSHQRIDPADIFNFACPLIVDDLLISLNSRVAPIFMKVMENRIQIRTLEKLRDTLLPKLISGEVRVKI
jgi:type I restriction enzyme, S subunit